MNVLISHSTIKMIVPKAYEIFQMFMDQVWPEVIAWRD